MADKDKRFELRLSAQEKEALVKLAERRGTDKSAVVASMIRRAAKRAKVWE